MKIDFLKLLNFRNYNHLEITFHPTLNLIYGKNGSGKTNLVEAIAVLALTRSFRLVGDKTLIEDGFEVSKISGEVTLKYKTLFEVILSKEGKKVKINHNKVLKLSDYISKMTIVLFHPDDLRFIKDTPSTRRKTLNISISLVDLSYLRNLSCYNALLKQRNAYLKQSFLNQEKDSCYLSILNEKLVDYGYAIYEKRKEFIEKMNHYLSHIYEKITGIADLNVKYISDYDHLKKEQIIEKMEKNLTRDMTLGKTQLGIHTDDLRFFFQEKDLKDYGSEGQQKNAIIAYKLSELEIFKDYTNQYPIFILDDLFSELDKEKVQNILSLLNQNVQTFITTTDLSYFESLNCYSYKSFFVEDGKIVRENVHERGK